jgi:Transposase IS66 family
VSRRVAQKVARLQVIVAERAAWAPSLAPLKRMRQWVLDAEHILDGSWVQAGEVLSNATVGHPLDAWRETMSKQLTAGTLSELEQACLTQFLQELSNLRAYLVQCYDRKDFPRTNNDMERSIRGLKTQYRRISGRKNWNSYLLRYGRCVAYASWWEQDTDRQRQLEQSAARMDRAHWRQLRQQTTAAQNEQLQRFRFRHKREAYLCSLEERWAAASPTPLLP